MADDPRLSTLLARREEMRQRGETVVLEALCHDCPELLSALREQVEHESNFSAVPKTLEMVDASSAPPTLPPTVLRNFGEEASKNERAALDSQPSGPPQVPGYEVLGELGRGGMGVVYKARHLRLNRLVALKMVLAGAHAGTSQLVRFQIEAQSVASLHHPNIVQVYDDGIHDHCPYLALEYVEGGGLDEKLAGKRMPPDEAAHLVEQLARAMHVAHLRGIIHRDLKPANILLTTDGTPKISDFGLAKNLEGHESQTRSGSVLGTPSYMAPEQALGRVREVGPHSDVYSLGAILYECLAGQPPFHSESVMQTLSLVQTVEVTPPSRVAKTPLPRDLETICMKCLQKAPGRRYPTAEKLADDLARYLNGEPIEARPVGRLERFAMWTRRRPAVAGLLAVSLVAVLVVFGVLVWSHFEVRSALHRAERNLARAREAIDEFYVQFAEEWLDDAAHMDEQQKRFVNRAPEHYEELAREEGNDPSLQRDQALALMRTGQIYTKLDQKTEAEDAFKRALAIQEKLVASGSGRHPHYSQDLANTHNWYGELLRMTGRGEEALTHYEEARDIQQQLFDVDSANMSYRHELARSTFNRGLIREQLRDTKGVRQDFEEAIDLLKPLAGPDSTNAVAQLDLAKARLNLGGLLRDVNEPKQSRIEYGLAIELLRLLHGKYPGKIEYRFELAKANKNLGNLLERNLGAFNEALVHHLEARKILDALVNDFPMRPRYRQEQGRVALSLGSVYWRLKNNGEAETNFQKAVEVFQFLKEQWPENAEHRREYGLAERTLGWFYLRIVKNARALGCLERAEEPLRDAARNSQMHPEYRRDLRECLRYLAEARLAEGGIPEAAKAATEVADDSDADDRERYQAASLLARCGKAEYADHAMRTLTALDPAKIRKSLLADKDTMFAPLKEREEFKKLVAKVEALPAP